MRILILTLLCVLASSASAGIFKHVDKDGNVTYTDAPTSMKDKAVNPSPMTTFTPPPAPNTASGTSTKDKQEQAPTSYTSLLITSPANNQAIRANSGSITVGVQSVPALDVAAGHRYVLTVDGQPQPGSQSGNISVSGLARGSHTLSVQIQDSDNTVLASSSAVQVDILRASIQNPNHPANSPRPPANTSP